MNWMNYVIIEDSGTIGYVDGVYAFSHIRIKIKNGIRSWGSGVYAHKYQVVII